LIDLYDAEIACTDIEIGRLVSALSQRLAKPDVASHQGHSSKSTRRPVLLVLTADHGEELLDHGGAFHGYTAYRELTHVPLILVGGDIPQRRVHEIVREIDVTPTLLDLAGISSSEKRGGASLRPFFNGGEARSRPAVTEAEMQTRYVGVKLAAIETDGWKFIRDDVKHQDLLYDLTKDRLEQVNVAELYPDRAAELEVQLDQILAALPQARRSHVEIDPETREQQRQLGY
jgi:arylsulfatase A-like enzyme